MGEKNCVGGSSSLQLEYGGNAGGSTLNVIGQVLAVKVWIGRIKKVQFLYWYNVSYI